MVKTKKPARPDSQRRLQQAIRLARVLRLLECIQSRGRWNVASLAAELECSPRTVHRYLDALELAGVPWTFDRKDDSYHVLPDYRFPVVSLSNDELLGQAIATAITSSDGLAWIIHGLANQ